MSSERASALQVLRGLRMEGTPLRLGRASADAAALPAESTLLEQAALEETLRQERALALREAREEGLRCGRAEGLREGHAQAAEEVRQAVQRAVAEAERHAKAEHERLRSIGQHARASLADLLWSAQDELVALCFETLCRVVGAAALRPEFIRAQLDWLMAQHGAPDVLLHVHPQDAQLLAGATPELAAVPVRADPEVAAGGCVLRSASGALDARLDTMLEACKAALIAARANAVGPGACGEAP